MQEQQMQIIQRLSRLKSIVSELEVTDNEISKESEVLFAEKSVLDLLGLYSKQDKVYDDMQKLNLLCGNIVDVEARIKETEIITGASSIVNNLLIQYQKLNDLTYKYRELSKVYDDLRVIEKRIKYAEEEFKALESDYEQAMPKGSRCPLCNNIIK